MDTNKVKLTLATTITVVGALVVTALSFTAAASAARYLYPCWFLLGLTLAGGPLVVIWRRQAREHHSARTVLEGFCRDQRADLDAALAIDMHPDLGTRSPWHDLLHRVHQVLLDARTRLEEGEHARAALEIRVRRQAAEAARTTRILKGLAEPVIVVDPYDAVLLSNTSAERLFGFDGGSAAGQSLSHLPGCDKLAAILSEVRHRKVTSSRTQELEVEGADGVKRNYRVTALGVPDEADSGDRTGPSRLSAVAVLRDISQQKATQRNNAEFVSAASHEMKTPLAGIKAYVELLADGDATDEATREEFLGVINGQADRLQRLIDNLLNLARIEAGVVEVSKHSQSLNDILVEAARVVQPSAEAKRIDLVQELSPLYLGVHVDSDLILQAAINLLSNAVKYTPPDNMVTLRSRLADREVVFEVEDTGVGLSEEDCQRVFDKFYRVAKDKNMASGTGLGLPLAKYIVEDVHNGRLTVESQPGVGSTFRVALPGSAQLRS